VATAKFLDDLGQYDAYLDDIRKKINDRLVAFHNGFQSLRKKGYHVDSIAPQAAIYLTIRFALHGQKTADGKTLATTKDVTKYILDEAKLAVVPFYAFGSSPDSDWYRLSVGTCRLEDVNSIIESLDKALSKLS
jgi:aspartate aminotransferase